MLKRSYRTRKGAFGRSKRHKAKGIKINTNSDVAPPRPVVSAIIDVGQFAGNPIRLFGVRVTYGLSRSQQRRLM